MVVSGALLNLRRTRVPGHAFVGSATLATADQEDHAFIAAYSVLQDLDNAAGPYRGAGAIQNGGVLDPCSANKLANFAFNLDYNVPPLGPQPGCALDDPNYDLVLSSRSTAGLMPPGAITAAQALGLQAHLDHLEFLTSPKNQPVSERLVTLLKELTTGSSFAFFPGNLEVPLSPTEQLFATRMFNNEAMFDPKYLDEGGPGPGEPCPITPPFPTPPPIFSQLRVEPEQLALRSSVPSPIFVYGLSGGQWLNVQAVGVSWRQITLTSSNESVVKVATDAVTGIPVVVAPGMGSATLNVTVKDTPGIVQVPVTVEGVPVQAVLVSGTALSPFSFKPVSFGFLSSPSFDALRIQPPTIRIGGQPPVPFNDGTLARARDLNGDGRLDLEVQIAPASLNLVKGATNIPLTGTASAPTDELPGSVFVRGFAFASVTAS